MSIKPLIYHGFSLDFLVAGSNREKEGKRPGDITACWTPFMLVMSFVILVRPDTCTGTAKEDSRGHGIRTRQNQTRSSEFQCGAIFLLFLSPLTSPCLSAQSLLWGKSVFAQSTLTWWPTWALWPWSLPSWSYLRVIRPQMQISVDFLDPLQFA